MRATLPAGEDVLAFQCRNPIHRAHYELFTRALDAENVRPGAICLVHPTCGPTQVIHTSRRQRVLGSSCPGLCLIIVCALTGVFLTGLDAVRVMHGLTVLDTHAT